MARPRVELSVIVALAILFVGAATPSETVGASKGALEGSWRVSIAGGTGTPTLPDWYGALVTFTHEGGLVATITDGTISTGHGAWAKIGSHTFAITIELRKFDPDGTFLGTLKASATISLNNAATQFHERRGRATTSSSSTPSASRPGSLGSVRRRARGFRRCCKSWVALEQTNEKASEPAASGVAARQHPASPALSRTVRTAVPRGRSRGVLPSGQGPGRRWTLDWSLSLER